MRAILRTGVYEGYFLRIGLYEGIFGGSVFTRAIFRGAVRMRDNSQLSWSACVHGPFFEAV